MRPTAQEFAITLTRVIRNISAPTPVAAPILKMTVLRFNLRKLFHLPKNRLLMGVVLIAITSLMTKWYAHSDPVITTVEHVTQSSIKPSTIDQDISAPVPKRIVLSNQFGDINIRSGSSSRYPKVITISVGSLFFLMNQINHQA